MSARNWLVALLGAVCAAAVAFCFVASTVDTEAPTAAPVHASPAATQSTYTTTTTTASAPAAAARPAMSAALKLPKLLANAVVLAPRAAHKGTVVFLHGLGDEGPSFTDMFQDVVGAGTRVVLPTAAPRPVTVNGGMRMNAWYDIYAIGRDRSLVDMQDEQGVLASAADVAALLAHEAALIADATGEDEAAAYRRIVLGGFSQGAAMSLHTAIALPHRLGAVTAFSGYCVLSNAGDAHVKTTSTPITMVHGTADSVVPAAFARESVEWLRARGVEAVDYAEEPGVAHTISRKGLVALHAIIRKTLPDAQ